MSATDPNFEGYIGKSTAAAGDHLAAAAEQAAANGSDVVADVAESLWDHVVTIAVSFFSFFGG